MRAVFPQIDLDRLDSLGIRGAMGPRVLVADDDAAQRELLAEMLAVDGYTVQAASNGKQAAEMANASPPPDLILLDVELPYKTGFEICREVKANPDLCLIPVVMVTGLTEARDRVRGIEAGADDFLTKPVDRFELIARVRSLLKRKEYTDELDRADNVLMALGRSIEAKDPYTHGHCARIARYSVLLGKELGLGRAELRALRISGSLHDIGKIGVPDAILLKKGPLNEAEWAVMRNHSILGERICKPMRSLDAVLPIIRSHHEKQDGSGYPDGLTGEKIPLLARVMQLIDVFDALTTERPYKCAIARAEALNQMQIEVDRGWWDPRLFTIFAQVVEREKLPDRAPDATEE
ncbi:MAG TPA: HD domain-containing phosphohydrolase [Terracidiphilus sp.]|nr:HD domain-containing phosphohydrolase [Terracidiphilus sp.]